MYVCMYVPGNLQVRYLDHCRTLCIFKQMFRGHQSAATYVSSGLLERQQ